MNELERLEQLKGDAIANPPKKVKGGCKSCKKKKEEVKEVVLPPIEVPEYYPSVLDITSAYVSIINLKGISQKDKPLVSKVYKALFNEEFDYECISCMSKQAIKFYNYCKEKNII